jgi:hypothetical protein
MIELIHFLKGLIHEKSRCFHRSNRASVFRAARATVRRAWAAFRFNFYSLAVRHSFGRDFVWAIPDHPQTVSVASIYHLIDWRCGGFDSRRVDFPRERQWLGRFDIGGDGVCVVRRRLLDTSRDSPGSNHSSSKANKKGLIIEKASRNGMNPGFDSLLFFDDDWHFQFAGAILVIILKS